MAPPESAIQTAIAQTQAVQPAVATPKFTNTAFQAPTNTPELSNTPLPTNTPEPTNTPAPTNTPVPTETPNPNLIEPGTYIVGTDIQPGIYKGQAGTDSCYWVRLKDVSGNLDSILANDNSVGQFYVEILTSDYAFETHCELILLSSLPTPTGELPQIIEPGTYLVGIDIQPGTYKGQAGSDTCYWVRLKDVSGDFDSILANDNAVGQFYVQVIKSDFALETHCELVRVGD